MAIGIYFSTYFSKNVNANVNIVSMHGAFEHIYTCIQKLLFVTQSRLIRLRFVFTKLRVPCYNTLITANQRSWWTWLLSSTLPGYRESQKLEQSLMTGWFHSDICAFPHPKSMWPIRKKYFSVIETHSYVSPGCVPIIMERWYGIFEIIFQ